MKRIIAHLRRMYRLSLTFKKQEEIVWNDLKKHHKDQEYQSGVFEKDRYIESFFKISDDKSFAFYSSNVSSTFTLQLNLFSNIV